MDLCTIFSIAHSTAKRLPPALLALALGLAGCDQAPTEQKAWALGPAEALQRLQRADLAGFLAAESCGTAIDLRVSDDGQATATIDASSGLFRVASFTVRLEPAGADTLHAIVEIPADPQGGEIYDGNGKHYDHPAFMQPLRPALEELVAAALENRRFDPTHLPEHLPDDGCSAHRPLAHPGATAATGKTNGFSTAGVTPSATDTPAGPNARGSNITPIPGVTEEEPPRPPQPLPGG